MKQNHLVKAATSDASSNWITSMEIIPGILVHDQATFQSRLTSMEGLASTLHLDCMDGHFVQNKTWYAARPLKTSLKLELHLMVSDPVTVMRDWRNISQVKRALWHVEIPIDHESLITECHKYGWECGLAISPQTPASSLAPWIKDLDEVLVLGVEPGWSGQALIPSTLEKLTELRKMRPSLQLGFDGGINRLNLKQIESAGADRVIITSAIFGAPDPKAELRAILETI